MAANEPIDPRVRLAISQWPDDAPRGAVAPFCIEHGISRQSFYKLRRRCRQEGQAAILEPRSCRPRSSPTKIADDAVSEAVQVRAALAASGLDHGPISVYEKMTSMGLDTVPSTASLARIFREAGVARIELKKRPRAAWRRFVYPAPNACWQLDATEYVLTGGRTCVIFQLEDDHSRLEIASHVAWTETADAAITVFDKGVTEHGVPQRLLTDNGSALNPSRRGFLGQLVVHVQKLGVEPITGKPYKPTTQGKNERLHRTLFQYLHAQPMASTLAELQIQVDAFDLIYNTERPHQSLPGRITPLAAYRATDKAQSPRPQPDRSIPVPGGSMCEPPQSPRTVIRKLSSSGAVKYDYVQYLVDPTRPFEMVRVIHDGNTLFVSHFESGELLLQTTKAPPGTTYVGRRTKATPPQPSPKS